MKLICWGGSEFISEGVLLMGIAFAPRLAFHGFDRTASPKWQMVPVGGQRVLNISGHGTRVLRVRAGADVLTAVQTVSGRHTVLTLTGGSNSGRASVEWVPNASFVGAVEPVFSLEVSVKEVKEVNTAFHYVDDGHHQITSRRIADLDALIAGANHLLTPQANVNLKRKSAARLPVAQNLGRVVRFSQHLEGPPNNVPAAQHEWDDLFNLRDTTADFNVFFVKEYEQDITPLHDDADAGTIAADQMCIYEDNQGNDSRRSLAHETVHVLGVSAHSSSNSYLMATGRNGVGRFIDRTQANTINTSGT
jgi:hypothetical protein